MFSREFARLVQTAVYDFGSHLDLGGLKCVYYDFGSHLTLVVSLCVHDMTSVVIL